jgi:hypothetical protein
MRKRMVDQKQTSVVIEVHLFTENLDWSDEKKGAQGRSSWNGEVTFGDSSSKYPGRAAPAHGMIHSNGPFALTASFTAATTTES